MLEYLVLIYNFIQSQLVCVFLFEYKFSNLTFKSTTLQNTVSEVFVCLKQDLVSKNSEVYPGTGVKTV